MERTITRISANVAWLHCKLLGGVEREVWISRELVSSRPKGTQLFEWDTRVGVFDRGPSTSSSDVAP